MKGVYQLVPLPFMSIDQFCGLLEIDPQRFSHVDMGRWVKKPEGGQRFERGIQIWVEPDHGADKRDVSATE